MPRKIENTTKAHLVSVPLPNHAATYTVISHQFIIDYAFQSLATAGFGIVDEEYRCTADGQIAQGIYKLNFNSDPELSMMFAWTNSYNKQVKFKCVVGAYINNTGSVMISGEVGSWVRKHTGTADTEVKSTIDNYITNAYMYYNQLCSDKAAMELVALNRRKQSQLLGVLFAEYEILTTEQASMIRDQMKRPQQVFTNTESLWAFYNYVTNALQSSHPKTWMEDQRILHYFIGTICDFNAPVQSVTAQIPVAVIEPIEDQTVFVDPNQTNLLDQIAAAEADLEADLMDEDLRYKHAEAVEFLDLLINADEAEEILVSYTDPMGNTFETIDFHNAVTSDPGDDDDDDDADIWTEQHIVEKDDTPFEIDENQEWTGENSSYMSLEVAPEDIEQAELDLTNKEFVKEKIIYEKDAIKTANFDDFMLDNEETNEDQDLSSDFF